MATVALTSVHQLGEALTPVVVGLAIDRAVAPGDLVGVLSWVGVLAAVYVVLSAAGNGAMPIGARAATGAEHDLRQAVVARALDARGTARPPAPGALLSVATSDAAVVGGAVEALAYAVSGLVALLAAGIALLVLSVPLGLVALGCVLVVALGVPLVGRPLQERSAAQQEAAAQSSALAVDLVTGLRVLSGLGAQRAAADRYRGTSRATLRARLRAAAAEGGFDGLTRAVAGLLLVAVAAVGVQLTLEGALSAGELVAAVGLAQFLVEPVARLAGAGADAAQIRASARRIADVLDAPVAVPDGNGADATGADATGADAHGAVGRAAFGRIEPGSATTPAGWFEPGPVTVPSGEIGSGPAAVGGIAVTVRGLRGRALHGLDLDLHPAELVGVACPDPAAAGELLDALARRADPAGGTVAVGGRGVAEIRLGALRATVVVLPHEPDLFTEELTEMFGAVPDAAVAAALAAAVATDVARELRGGGSRHGGVTLSGGQRQRLALARALAVDPPVLVLHDPTTALDPATEARLARGVHALRAGRCTAVVTTSAGLLAVADRVVLVHGGRAVAHGPHHELLADPRYAAAVLA